MPHDNDTSHQPAGARSVSVRRGTVSLARQSFAGLRVLVVLTLVLGLAYPLVVWGVGQLAFPWQANGSLVRADGSHARDRGDGTVENPIVGSVLLGQSFTGDEWFHPRPSASDYDTLASGGSNLSATSPELAARVAERRGALEAAGIDPADITPDALTASGSGLDPHVSPEYAEAQVARVAAARDLDPATVIALVAQHTRGRDLGVLGEPRVDVLELNLALGMMSS